MRLPAPLLAGMLAAAASLSACSTNDETGADGAASVDAGASGTAGADTTGSTGGSTGTGTSTGTDTSSGTDGAAGTGGSTGTGGIPALVNVNLENVLNNLAVDLKIDRANIPVNAQVPIDVAANVCGVSVSALSASIASGQAGCTAKTTSPALNQAVQQQVAAGGNVGGGEQTMGSPTENQF